MEKSEAGKRGAIGFWNKFNTNPAFKKDVLKKWKRKDKKPTKKACKEGAKVFWNKFYSNEKFRKGILKKWKNKKRYPSKIKKAAKRAAKMSVRIRQLKYEKELRKFKKQIKEKKKKILLARLCGFLVGDGSVSIRKEKPNNNLHYTICFYPDHISMVKLFNKTFSMLFDKIPKTKVEKKYYIIRINSKLACNILLSFNKFGSLEWKMPSQIFKTKAQKREWIRAFFDCEAYVGKRVIQVQSVNKAGLFQVKKLLEEFGINSKIYKYKRKNKNWNINYILCIMKKDSRKRYLKEIGFNHLVKQRKLKHFAGIA